MLLLSAHDDYCSLFKEYFTIIDIPGFHASVIVTLMAADLQNILQIQDATAARLVTVSFILVHH